MASSTPSGSSLAFSNPTNAKIEQQRKILEELERQKKLLNKGGSGGGGATVAAGVSVSPAAGDKSGVTASTPSNAASVGASSASAAAGDPNNPLLTPNQRAALETAAKTSFGYFIAQDSSFGNTILPVIPRHPPPTAGGGKQ